MELLSPLPKNWQQFLRVGTSKTELFRILSSELMASSVTNRQLIVTNGPGVLCVPLRDPSNLAPCAHDEVDTTIMVHIADAVKQG